MSFWDTQTTQTKPKSNFWGSSVQPKPEPVLAKPKLLQYQQEAQQAQQVAQKENSFWNITKNTLKGIPKAAAGVAADIVRAPARGVLSTALTIAPKSVQQQIGQINPEEDFGKIGKYALGDQPIQTISGTGKSTLQSFGVQNEGVLNRLATPVGIGLTALDVYPGGQGKKGAKGLLNVAKESVEKVAKQIPENDLKFLSNFASKVKTKEVVHPSDSKIARAIFKENGYEVPKTDKQLADLINMADESKSFKAFNQEVSPQVNRPIFGGVNPQSGLVNNQMLRTGAGASVGSAAGFEKDEQGNINYNVGKGVAGAVVGGIVGNKGKLGMSIEDVSKNAYKGEKDLTTKILKDLEGKTTVSKQYILDATNRGELKQVERDLVRNILNENYPPKAGNSQSSGTKQLDDTINVADFARKVKAELLPLETKESYIRTNGLNQTNNGVGKYSPQYESISLPDDVRGKVKNYQERIYESPIKTSAGNIHFSGKEADNYFGHTRIEDMADNKTRRVIEVQSDLYQKGRLEQEATMTFTEEGKRKFPKYYNERMAEVKKLQQYNDPTAHFRMIREEIKKAAEDGKTKLQFPTGETAMKIEGLGERNVFSIGHGPQSRFLKPEDLKVGLEINDSNLHETKIITDVLGDGKFKAVPKNVLDDLIKKDNDFYKDVVRRGGEIPKLSAKERVWENINDMSRVEEFDISGKVDTNNPIYRFYEKDMQKYLGKFGGKRVVDDKGVSWVEVPINKGMASTPVEAFGAVAGLEQDEEGNIKFNPEKAGLGILGVAGLTHGKKFLKPGVVEGDALQTLKNVEARVGVKPANIKAAEDNISKYKQMLTDPKSDDATKSFAKRGIEGEENYLSKRVGAEPKFRAFDKNKKVLGEVAAKDFYGAEEKAKELFGDKYSYSMTKPNNEKPHLKFDENGRKLAYTPKEKAIINRSEYDEGWFGRKKTELPEEIQKKEYQLQLEKEALAENPAAKLSKYVAKSGEFKGGLKEVTGTGKSAFGRKGDDIVTELGFKDSEEARVAYDNYVAKKESIKGLEQQLKNEITSFKAKPKDPILPKPSASPRVGSDGDLRSLEQVAQEAQARGTGNSGVKLPSLPQIISKTPTPVSKKVGIIDYIRTPDRVLNKIGLGKEMEIVRKGYDGYLEELPKNIDKITEWSKQVPKESSERIFKWLDGQAIDLRPEETKVANEVKTWLSQWADRLGLPKDKQISNYITHLFDDQLIKKEFDEDLAKIIADKVPGSVYDPFLLQRLGAKGYKQDVWAALDAYVKRGTRKVHMDPALSHLEEAAGSLEKSAWDYVKNYADRINMRPSDWDTRFDNSFKQMFGYRAGQRPLANISRTLRQVTFRGMLGGNIGSAMRNISQGVNTYSKLGEKYTAKGYMDLIAKGTKELKQVGVLQDNIVQDRVLSATKKTMEKIDKGLFFFFDTAEKINRGAAYYGAKAKALSQGKTETEAIEVAKKLVRDTQFLYSSIDTPLGMQGDIAKVLTQFMSYPVKQTEFLVEMAKNKEFAGLARYALGGLAFTYTIGQAFNMDPQEFIPWSGYLTGDQKFGAPPSLKFPYEAVKAGFDAPDKFGNQRTLGEKASDVGKASLGWIPAGSQIKKTFEGVRAFNQGAGTSATGRVRYPIEQTLTNRLKTGLFGQYATPEAEQYFDKEQTPLSEKQSQEVLNSANPKEAFDQIKQIQAENKAKEIKNAEHKAKIQPVFDQALSLVKAGDTAGAEQLVNDLSEEDFEVYKGIRSSWRASNTSKARDLLGINNPVEAVKFLRSLPESENARIVDLLTDEEYQLLLEGKEQQ